MATPTEWASGNLGPLKDILRSRSDEPPPGATCDLCATPIHAEHGHLVDLDNRGLRCTCRPCAVLFTQQGAGRRRFKAVPGRVRHDPAFALTRAQWDAVQIPVSTAFLFHNADLGRTVAFYPSPAGATESLLDLESWEEVLAANPALADLESDVEAVLLHKIDDGDERGGSRFEAFGVPIDLCYELVGLVRVHWKGFDGGTEFREAMAAFLQRLREGAEVVGHAAREQDGAAEGPHG